MNSGRMCLLHSSGWTLDLYPDERLCSFHTQQNRASAERLVFARSATSLLLSRRQSSRKHGRHQTTTTPFSFINRLSSSLILHVSVRRALRGVESVFSFFLVLSIMHNKAGVCSCRPSRSNRRTGSRSNTSDSHANETRAHTRPGEMNPTVLIFHAHPCGDCSFVFVLLCVQWILVGCYSNTHTHTHTVTLEPPSLF